MAKLNFGRTILSVLANKERPLFQLDIKNVFLHDNLQAEAYMQQPPGVVVHGEEDKVCFMHKSLYELKQSPRAWLKNLAKWLSKYGL